MEPGSLDVGHIWHMFKAAVHEWDDAKHILQQTSIEQKPAHTHAYLEVYQRKHSASWSLHVMIGLWLVRHCTGNRELDWSHSDQLSLRGHWVFITQASFWAVQDRVDCSGSKAILLKATCFNNVCICYQEICSHMWFNHNRVLLQSNFNQNAFLFFQGGLSFKWHFHCVVSLVTTLSLPVNQHKRDSAVK